LAGISARSVVFDLFGDYVRYTGGAIGLAPLCDLLAPFGVTPEAARTVMTRLRSEGWFGSEKDGRSVTYFLTPKAISMLDEGRDRIFSRDTSPWDGLWHMVIYQVPEQQRKTREALRKRLTFLGYGSLAPATWISARDHSAQVTAIVEGLTLSDCGVQVTQMVTHTASRQSDRELADRCWQLEEINAQYERWLVEWGPTIKSLHTGKLLGPDALVTRVRLVRSFRNFPFSDPELPAELLPVPWQGTDAFLAFMDAHRSLEKEANAWYRSTLSPSDNGGQKPQQVTVKVGARGVRKT
jgi:phenylacetic acid degradation operon negative regulatory protein